MAPSTSNFASDRVLPPLAIASASSSSRRAWIALDIARSISPRCAKVSACSAAPPRDRANARASPMSSPAVDAVASGSSVAGLTSAVAAACPATHRPCT